ncbi:MAG TPA: hypothetical protein VKE74_15195 [Gemmataceae bacterium]|nr:hypothetical protein [Gemmataceae bacterium]
MSSETRCITFGQVRVYALVVPLPGSVRVRLSADDWERLGLPVGARVDLATLGKLGRPYFIRAAVYVDPGWQWIDCVPAPVVAGIGRQGTSAAEPRGPP